MKANESLTICSVNLVKNFFENSKTAKIGLFWAHNYPRTPKFLNFFCLKYSPMHVDSVTIAKKVGFKPITREKSF